jgi:DNA-3-methyladenine glycosylase
MSVSHRYREAYMLRVHGCDRLEAAPLLAQIQQNAAILWSKFGIQQLIRSLPYVLPLIRFHWFPFRVGVMQGGREGLVRRKIRLPNRPGGLPRLPAAKPLEAPFTIRRLRRSELPADTVALARFLIGKIVVRELPGVRLSGRIVETEAYPQRDPAAHHFRGPTPRNRSMFLRRGHAYVYFSYGNHFMLNVSAEIPGIGGGVLIRALEPLDGIQRMQHHRKTTRLLDLARGPGRLASALRIDRSLDGADLCAPGPLWLGAIVTPRTPTTEPRRALLLGKSPRIGITRAAHRLFRFYERGSPFVSGPSRLRS